MAQAYPLVDVPAGRVVLCAAGAVKPILSPVAPALAGVGGRVTDHFFGTALWPEGEPILPGVGLSERAAEFPRADLPAL